ncbi:MAG: DUF2442 domain-containing protein [Gemmatimonadaceae bacterium]|nr:DUF2442 domain-containing protein [Gemmatimonadaceae bacterium]
MRDSYKITPEFRAQLRAARRFDAAERAAGRRAVSASYDHETGRIMLELSNGSVFGFVASRFPTLAALSTEELANVTVSPGGTGLFWNDDVDLSVAGLLLDAVDQRDKRSELARMAGSTRSAAKAAAARKNGKKGGRPRKRPAVARAKSK